MVINYLQTHFRPDFKIEDCAFFFPPLRPQNLQLC